jgi:hypothetical protein
MKGNPSSFETHSGGWEGLRRKWIRIHLLSSILVSVNHARFGLQTVFSNTQSDRSISRTGSRVITDPKMLSILADRFTKRREIW